MHIQYNFIIALHNSDQKILFQLIMTKISYWHYSNVKEINIGLHFEFSTFQLNVMDRKNKTKAILDILDILDR